MTVLCCQAYAGAGLEIGHEKVRMGQYRTTRDDVYGGGGDHGKWVVWCDRDSLQSLRGMIESLERRQPRRLCAAQRVPIRNVRPGLRPVGHQGQSVVIDEEHARGSTCDDTADLFSSETPV